MTGDDIKGCQITMGALARFPDTGLFVCPGAYSRGNQQTGTGVYCGQDFI